MSAPVGIVSGDAANDDDAESSKSGVDDDANGDCRFEFSNDNGGTASEARGPVDSGATVGRLGLRPRLG